MKNFSPCRVPQRLPCRVPQRRLELRKGDFGDTGRTTLKPSGIVETITAVPGHQKSSPYDDARGSYPRYPIAIAPSSSTTASRRGRAIFREAARKDDFVDNAPTTLKTSEFVKLINAVTHHQTASPYDDVRGSYEQYPVTACTTRVTLSNQPWTPRPS